jgi:hypothetical protein
MKKERRGDKMKEVRPEQQEVDLYEGELHVNMLKMLLVIPLTPLCVLFVLCLCDICV